MIRDLKRVLKERSQEELIDEILLLCKQFKEVESYFRLRMDHDYHQQLIETYKAQILQEFFPKRGFGLGRPSVGKKPIAEYKKVAGSPVGLADLMLYYVF
jgi:hypothetical protein